MNGAQQEMQAPLGLGGEPTAILYSHPSPPEGMVPEPGEQSEREKEAAEKVDWGAVFSNFTCFLGPAWRVRKKGRPFYLSARRFWCAGGGFWTGFLKPQTETVIHYVSPHFFAARCPGTLCGHSG